MAQPRLEKRQLWLMVRKDRFRTPAFEQWPDEFSKSSDGHGVGRRRAPILQSTFTSLDAFAANHWAPGLLLRDHFDNLSVTKSFPGPLLVIHGRDDRVIPASEGLRLAAASGHATFRLYDCGHGCWDPQRLPFWPYVIPILLKAGILSPDRKS